MFSAQHANAAVIPYGVSPNLAGVGLADVAGQRFMSNDRDEVRGYVGRMYCDHSLDLVNADGRLDTRIAHLRCGGVALTDMSYGADVMIDAGRLEDFYLVQIPVAGRSGLSLGGKHGDYGPGRASVQNPQVPLAMYWSGDCRKLVLRYDRAGFERFVEACVGRPLRGCVDFEPWFDTDSRLGAMLIQQVQAVIGMARHGAAGGAVPALLERHLETTLMGMLLFLQPHDLTAQLTQATPGADPAPVRRVRDYLEAHAHEPIDLADLVAVAGVPLRTLHHQFRHVLGVSPMQLLRDIRLDRVRAELASPHETTNVTQAAMNWGFEHLGRFAVAYRRRFGETPRETLGRQRGG